MKCKLYLRGSFIHYNFLKPHYISHKIMHITFLWVEALLCKSRVFLSYPKIIGNPIVNVYQTVSYLYISILSCNWNEITNTIRLFLLLLHAIHFFEYNI